MAPLLATVLGGLQARKFKQKPEALGLSFDLSMVQLMQVQCAQTHVCGSEFSGGSVSATMSGTGPNTEAPEEFAGNPCCKRNRITTFR
jgi:hypothetical protein